MLWTGYETSSWPQRDEARVADALGADVAASAMPRVRELERDFFAGAGEPMADLAAWGRRAAAAFTERHPDVPPEAVDALAWCFTYDSR